MTAERRATRTDVLLGGFGILYLGLILALLVADAAFTNPQAIIASLRSPEIQYAIRLSVVSCTVTTILAVWVAVPTGYVLARVTFRGKALVDTLLDIPIVLPPLVLGLSLLILFQTPPGKAIERLTTNHMGTLLAYVAIPLLCWATIFLVLGTVSWSLGWRLLGSGLTTLILVGILTLTGVTDLVERWGQRHFATPITYAIPSVILAQFTVSCAFAIRTMRVAFDQMSPRTEQVALTLGCTRYQAFWYIAVPEAWRGIISAAAISFARALGEFGPILIFSGATRMRTEVLSTTVFLELSIGKLEAALAVSLLMVAVAVVVLLIMRFFGMNKGMV